MWKDASKTELTILKVLYVSRRFFLKKKATMIFDEMPLNENR